MSLVVGVRKLDPELRTLPITLRSHFPDGITILMKIEILEPTSGTFRNIAFLRDKSTGWVGGTFAVDDREHPGFVKICSCFCEYGASPLSSGAGKIDSQAPGISGNPVGPWGVASVPIGTCCTVAFVMFPAEPGEKSRRVMSCFDSVVCLDTVVSSPGSIGKDAVLTLLKSQCQGPVCRITDVEVHDVAFEHESVRHWHYRISGLPTLQVLAGRVCYKAGEDPHDIMLPECVRQYICI